MSHVPTYFEVYSKDLITFLVYTERCAQIWRFSNKAASRVSLREPFIPIIKSTNELCRWIRVCSGPRVCRKIFRQPGKGIRLIPPRIIGHHVNVFYHIYERIFLDAEATL